MSFVELIMFKDKYPSIFSDQMEAIVFIIVEIFFATWAISSHVLPKDGFKLNKLFLLGVHYRFFFICSTKSPQCTGMYSKEKFPIAISLAS